MTRRRMSCPRLQFFFNCLDVTHLPARRGGDNPSPLTPRRSGNIVPA